MGSTTEVVHKSCGPSESSSIVERIPSIEQAQTSTTSQWNGPSWSATKSKSETTQQVQAAVDELQEEGDIFSLSLEGGFQAVVEDEFMLKMDVSLVIMILQNILLQMTFFSAVSSSSIYAEHLGGTATFSGLVIGIPTAVSAVTLAPILKVDQGGYLRPLHITCATMVLGSVLYALAYSTNFLYLILLGRMVQGIGFNGWLYTKRYITDPRVAGVRRRTTLSGFLVLGQGIGMSAGPFFGGLLFKIGFPNSVFNGLTAPGWLMAGIWVVYWAVCAVWFKDVPPVTAPRNEDIQLANLNEPGSQAQDQRRAQADRNWFGINPRQWGVIVTMCWFAMTCFFILGAWETNIPVFGASGPALPTESPSASSRTLFSLAAKRLPLGTRGTSSSLSPFHWSPFAAGNFIALGGITIFPFLFLNLLFARRTQDRHILALGSALGLAGLLGTLALLRVQEENAHALTYGAFFACWFLVALGFNLASTCTLSLLTKQLPQRWNTNTSLAIQLSNYTGRVTGAVWGGSGVKVGMLNYLGLEIAIIGIGAVMFMTLWRELKAKTG